MMSKQSIHQTAAKCTVNDNIMTQIIWINKNKKAQMHHTVNKYKKKEEVKIYFNIYIYQTYQQKEEN